jgi:hypothetical protein
MFSFKKFILTEGFDRENPEKIHGMPRVLHQFLGHLSSPVGTHHNRSITEEQLDEVTLFAGNSKLDSRKLPKTSFIIDKGHEDLPEGNLHKNIHQGFYKAFSEMKTETPEITLKKARASRKVYEDFARSRGFKGGGGSLLIENGKTMKSTGEGVHTKGLSLAPHSANGLKGFDVCPRASTECRANCLGTEAGGNRQYPDAALASKVLKTHFIAHHPEHAARLLDHEIGRHVAHAEKAGYKAGVRLNVTSDLPYEKYAPHLFERHPTAQFYDYTKMHQRVMNQSKDDHPVNYHLSLSHTGTSHPESNDQHAVKALEAGHVVAMVYQRGKHIPSPKHVEDMKTGNKYPIANGDDDDNTFDRHATTGLVDRKKGHGVVSGLKLKGVKNEDAGHFANPVDPDGVIRINR